MDDRAALRSEVRSYAPGKFRPPLKDPSLKQARVAVVGQTGSGKTCLINTTWRVLEGCGADAGAPLPETSTGQEGTVVVEDLQVAPGVLYMDTRGFFANAGSEAMAFIRIVEGQLQNGNYVKWELADDCVKTAEEAAKVIDKSEPVAFAKRVHGVIFVLKADDPRLEQGAYQRALELPRDWCRRNAIAPITVVTHDDLVQSDEKRVKLLALASACSGSSLDNIFFISNYTALRKGGSPATDLVALKIMLAVLMAADRHICLKCPPPSVTVVTVTHTDGVELKFRINKDMTFGGLRSLVQKRTKLDPEAFSLLSKNEEESEDRAHVLDVGDSFKVQLQHVLADTTCPKLWGPEPWGPSGYKEVDIAADSPEFLAISSLVAATYDSGSGFNAGCVQGQWPNGLQVRRVTRVHNRLLWMAYTDTKQLIRCKHHDASQLASSSYLARMRMRTPLLDSSVNEYLLFHGCDLDVVQQLLHEGGDFRKANIFGMFGAGFYLAENSSKANAYVPCPHCHRNACTMEGLAEAACEQTAGACACPEQEAIEYTMLIFRAALGDAHICTQYQAAVYKGTAEEPKRRPPVNAETGYVHDSVVAERVDACPPPPPNVTERNPRFREVVLYQLHQAYPEYRITFTRRLQPPPAVHTSCSDFWKSIVV
eukprot:TRINITY_DN4361_c0_g1_i1.p1 TRINITY_DN4361_c0_g1~~TRINITY_DN4361_c0_g1_i1.p1  ORF type:complete len:664 (-),score=153.64 TRINITY_DN4361_c0_g1_i1:42-2000(-)